MKVFAFIFSLFVLSLALVPCSDHELHEEETSAQADAGHSHGDEEHCTPFCICACCGTVVVPVKFFSIEIPSVAIVENPVFSAMSESETNHVALSVWQPPKLSV